MDTKNILNTYRTAIEILKTNLITDLNTAITTGQLQIDETTKPRLLALVDSLVTAHAANGYEQLQRITK